MPAAVWPHTLDSLRRSRSHTKLSGDRRRSLEGIVRDGALTIRRVRPEDGPALADLAELDSARPLDGEVLVALLEERPVAALELSGDAEIADPFWPNETALARLRVRADQLRAGAAPLSARARHGAGAARTAIR